VRNYLPTDDLAFLMELSIDHVVMQMGLLARPTGEAVTST
jgi:hypothetical protein